MKKNKVLQKGSNFGLLRKVCLKKLGIGSGLYGKKCPVSTRAQKNGNCYITTVNFIFVNRLRFHCQNNLLSDLVQFEYVIVNEK